MEEWKKIDGYDNYSVSRNGNVRNDKTCKILKKCKDKDGYEFVHLYKDGKYKTFKIHRIIAIAFIPNPNNLPCIDHINTIRDDNRIENLRWCTWKENNNNHLTRKNKSKNHVNFSGENNPMYGKHHSNSTKEKLKKANEGKQLSEETRRKISEAKKGENNPRCKKVILLNTGEVFDYIKQASEKYGVAHQSICACCRGRLKSAGKLNGEKLVWKYLDLM